MVLCALIATAWILAVAYGSHAFARFWISENQRCERHVAAALLGASAATFAFEVLAPLRLFSVGPASAAVFVYVVLAWLIARRTPREILEMLGADFAALVHSVFGKGKPLRLALGALLTLPVLLIGTRALILPPLGWDTLTYHGVKAAMWVQNQGALPLFTPGGWGTYRDYPAGAEILGAWAILPFSSDLLYPTVDVVCWLTLWPAILGLCRQLRLPEVFHKPISLYLMTVPSLYHWVGSGYVEPVLYMYLIGGSLFLVRFLQGVQPSVSAALTLLAFAAAAQVKINAIPWAMVGFVFIVATGLRGRALQRGWQRGAALGVVLGAAVLGPMLLGNWINQGLPLSPFPISLGSLPLGEATKVLAWYQGVHLGNEDVFTREWRVHAGLLGFDDTRPTSLGPISLGVLLLALFGIRSLWRTRSLPIAVGVAIIVVTLLGIYSPSFNVVRVVWSGVSERFAYGAYVWLGLFACAAPLLMQGTTLVRVVLVTASLWSAAHYALIYPGIAEWQVLAPSLFIAAMMAAGLVGLGFWRRERRRGPVLVASLSLLLFLGAWPLQALRDSIRYTVPEESQHGHSTHGVHAAVLASKIDDPEIPRRIAITHGPWQKADVEAMYFFLGRRLQNQIEYIPVTHEGVPYEFGGRVGVPAEQLDGDLWQKRLLDRGVTHVVVLCPPWHELSWMVDRPDRFRPIAETVHNCKLFRVEP